MILAALALLQAAPAAAPTPDADDIVVLARRREQMKRLRLVTRTDRKTKATRCVFKRRSGDSALDARVCAIVLDCTRGVDAMPAVQACLKPRMDALIPTTPWRATEHRSMR